MAARKSSYGKLAHMAQKVQGIDWASDASLVEADEQFARSAPLRERHHSCCHGCYNCCPLWVYTEDGVVVKIEGDYDGTLTRAACAPRPSTSSIWCTVRAMYCIP